MRSVTGVFASRADAEHAARKLASIGVPKDRISLLSRGQITKELQALPISAAERPGVAKALGGVVGAAVGLAGGFELGAVASAIVPGVGPVLAMGLAGAALLGLTGATVGAVAGDALENAATEGLPEDELFVYEERAEARTECPDCLCRRRSQGRLGASLDRGRMRRNG